MFFFRERVEPDGDRYGVEWAFTDRRGGSSQGLFGELNLGNHVGDRAEAVETNRHRLAREFGVRLADLRFMDQQHGCGVALTPGTAGQQFRYAGAPAVDALVSDRTDEVLIVLVADCVPVVLVDRIRGLVAAVHAGRPGLVAGVVPATVRTLRELGADDLEAVVGPSVCPACYEVPEAMREEVSRVSRAAWSVSATGTPAVDVASGVVEQLAAAGVALRRLPGCTREDATLFSHRRDGSPGGGTGRFAGVVRLLGRDRVA